ncbi:OmpP1/FadL family transporter [Mucisphaera sp.]|uniref:OmpP1/FadL family transporter n=1 Tax=Mucisphaera sp. TaxID=2913024 RepID=UPI003D0F4FE9
MHPFSRRLATWVICVLALTQANTVFAQGFTVYEQAARPVGMANATIADNMGPESVFYNPAAMADLTHIVNSTGIYIVHFDTNFTSSTGLTDNHNDTYAVPHGFWGFPLNDDLTLGIGLYNSFGLGTNWTTNGPLNTLVDRARLSINTLAVGLSWQVDDHLSIGATLNTSFGQIDRESNPFVPGVGPGRFSLQADGFAVNGTFGARYRLNDRHAFAAVVRTPFRIDLEGDATLSVPGVGSLANAPAAVNIDLPLMLTAGYSWTPDDRWTVNLDASLTYWENFNASPITTPDPILSAFPAERYDYETAFYIAIGTEYWIHDNLALRAGYLYSENVGPTATFSPLVPDLDAHLLSTGLGFLLGPVQIDLAYQFVHRMPRTINNSSNSPDGTYDDQTNTLMATITIPLGSARR